MHEGNDKMNYIALIFAEKEMKYFMLYRIKYELEVGQF